MFKPTTLITVFILFSLFASGYWFYTNMVTPQHGSSVRVTNLPWQITAIDDQTLHVFDLNVGQDTLGQAVKILKSEYEMAWFENQDNSISLEAYFIRVSISGLRAKVLLELDSAGLDKDYLIKNSGKPEIQDSRTIKYPVDDLAQEFSNRVIHSLTYIPKASVDPETIESYFGKPEERLVLNGNTEFWMYPKKGLVISISQRGKEVFQYIPVGHFSRLKQSVLATVKHAKEPVQEE